MVGGSFTGGWGLWFSGVVGWVVLGSSFFFWRWLSLWLKGVCVLAVFVFLCGWWDCVDAFLVRLIWSGAVVFLSPCLGVGVLLFLLVSRLGVFFCWGCDCTGKR